MNLIEQLLQCQNETTLLAKSNDSKQQVEVHQYDGLRWLFTGGQSIQSIMSLSEPSRFMYFIPEVMLVALLLQEAPSAVLNLGYGGGSFERFFAAQLPAVQMVSVDSSDTVVELTKKFMQTPTHWPVVIDNAQCYLQQTQLTFDLIFCDLFVGETHASCIATSAFYQDAARCLGERGVMAVNLCPQSDKALVELLICARRHFEGAMISKAGQLDNLILILSCRPLPSAAQLNVQAQLATERWKLDFSTLLGGYNLFPNQR
jgi:spermidine synthase